MWGMGVQFLVASSLKLEVNYRSDWADVQLIWAFAFDRHVCLKTCSHLTQSI